MSKYEKLYRTIINHMLRKRDLPKTHESVSLVSQTAALITLLEIFIDKKRQGISLPPELLENDRVLHFIILQKHNWHLDYIRSLTLSDHLLILMDELNDLSQSEEIKTIFDLKLLPNAYLDFLDDDRDAILNQSILELTGI